MTKKIAIEMGDEVKDTITGFKGVVTGTASYITGCDQALVSPKIKKDGTLTEAHWFDVMRIVCVKAKAVKLEITIDPGGPQQSPPTR